MLKPHLENGVLLPAVAAEHGIALRTAKRWLRQYRLHGLVGLCRKPYPAEARRLYSDKIYEAIDGLALHRPKLSARAIHRRILAMAKDLGLPAPSYASVYKRISLISPALMTMAQDGTKAYTETYDLIYRREADRPNEIWQADHTQLDILVRLSDGQIGRPWLTVILDDHSRAVAGYLLFLGAPSAIQTALALRHAIWRKAQPQWVVCGVPDVLYTDHGSDFTSRHIEEVAANLRIQLVFSTAGKPRGRGKIEKFFKTVNTVLLSRLPGFAPGQRGRSAILSMEELDQQFSRFFCEEYNLTPHGTTKVAPLARWSCDAFLPRMPDSLEQLDLLLLTVSKERVVRPDGIHFMGMRYIDPLLAAYVQERVLLRYDPRDMAEVRVFHQDMFLCRAVCQELAGETVPLKEIMNARDRQRRALRATLDDRRKQVASLLEARHFQTPDADVAPDIVPLSPNKLKRYRNE